MIITEYKVYIKVNDNNIITDINSDAFLTDTTNWTEIDSGYGDEYYHAQNMYLDKEVIGTNGVYNYKLVDGVITERTDEEIAADVAAKAPPAIVNSAMVSNPNLLVNPDFKINQRGLTEYTSPTFKYGVDRWTSNLGTSTFSPHENGIRVTTDGTAYAGIWQVSEFKAYCAGEKFTPSVFFNETPPSDWYIDLHLVGKDESGNEYYAAGSTNHDTANMSAGLVSLPALTIPADGEYYFRFFICNKGTTVSTVDIRYTKLEPGPVATQFVPPDPITEKVKCGIPDDTNSYGYTATVNADTLDGLHADSFFHSRYPAFTNADDCTANGTYLCAPGAANIPVDCYGFLRNYRTADGTWWLQKFVNITAPSMSYSRTWVNDYYSEWVKDSDGGASNHQFYHHLGTGTDILAYAVGESCPSVLTSVRVMNSPTCPTNYGYDGADNDFFYDIHKLDNSWITIKAYDIRNNMEFINRCLNGTWSGWARTADGGNAAAVGGFTLGGNISANDIAKLAATNIAYGTCATAAATAAKVVTIVGNTNWKLTTGSMIAIKFTNTNTASNATLNVNSTGAKSIWFNTGVLTTSVPTVGGYANRVANYIYDGTYYVFIGWSIDSNTTYGNASATAAGLISTGAQTFAGAKTFNASVYPNGATAYGTPQARKLSSGTDAATTTNCPSGAWYGQHS